MSRYRKVDTRIWNDAKFRQLTDDGKLVFFMLLTHPNMTSLGAMRATPSGIAEELGWTIKRFLAAFSDIIDLHMAEHDDAAHMIALPKFMHYNEPESPNVVRAWAKAVDLLPECELKNLTVRRAAAFIEDKPEGFRKAFAEAFAEALDKAFRQPSLNQEPEPEQEPEYRLSQEEGTVGEVDHSRGLRLIGDAA